MANPTPLQDPALAASRMPSSALVESAVVALGGAIGATLRFTVEIVLSRQEIASLTSASGALILVNLVGSFALGALTGWLERHVANPLLRPFLGIGVCGAFTTFSGFAVDIRLIYTDFGEAAAAIFFGLSLLGGALAYLAGRALGRRQDPPS